MMGQNSGNQNRLFYSFNLDDHVPASHLLRGINNADRRLLFWDSLRATTVRRGAS